MLSWRCVPRLDEGVLPLWPDVGVSRLLYVWTDVVDQASVEFGDYEKSNVC